MYIFVIIVLLRYLQFP